MAKFFLYSNIFEKWLQSRHVLNIITNQFINIRILSKNAIFLKCKVRANSLYSRRLDPSWLYIYMKSAKVLLEIFWNKLHFIRCLRINQNQHVQNFCHNASIDYFIYHVNLRKSFWQNFWNLKLFSSRVLPSDVFDNSNGRMQLFNLR